MPTEKTVHNDEAVRVLVNRRAYYDRELEMVESEAEALARRQDRAIADRAQICQALMVLGADPTQPPEDD